MRAAPDDVEIIPGLHVGAEPNKRAARRLAGMGVSHVVDLRDGTLEASVWPRGVDILSFGLTEFGAPPVEDLARLGRHIARLIQQGQVVYVHCRAGIQRAPMVACAVLMYMGWTLADAYQLVSSRRAVAAMSEEQLLVLRRLAAALDQRLGDAGSLRAFAGTEFATR
jgi:protein-tyrosine phosphatase